MHKCAQCGATFAGRKRKYCTHQCMRTAQTLKQNAKRKAEGYTYRKTTKGTCIRCGAGFLGRGGTNAKYCSKTCSAAVATTISAVITKKPRPVVLYTGRYVPREAPTTVLNPQHRLVSGQCIVCTAWFVSFHTDITCSTQCQAEHNKCVRERSRSRRRVRERDAFVENVYRKRVFERDGYRCHICRKKTDPTKQAPHPRSPTLDHLIPLSQGGTHEPTNCRTACFMCNSLRGDRGGGEQLLIIS